MAFCLLACFSSGAFAQADSDSPYSLFGVGQVRDKAMNVKLQGMGGSSNAMFGIGMINTENPASYAKIDSLAFLFDGGVYFKTSTFSTATLSERASNASFDYLSMAFGLFSWWKLALGVQPYSTTGYTMVVNGYEDEIGSYATRFKGTGGLNQALLGTAFKLGKHFSIGANAYYVFGNTKSETTLYFPDSLYMLGSRRNLDVMVSSFMFDYGVLFNANVGKDLELSIGATYTQPIKLRGTETLFIRSIEENAETEVEYVIDTLVNTTSKTKTQMPQGFGVGVALQKYNHWGIAADFNWKQWSKFAREGVNAPLQDSWSASLGFQFTPTHSTISNYFRKMTYRVGGFYEHGMINLLGNDDQYYSINRFGATAGMSFPLPRSLSMVDLAFEAGQYGTREGGLIQERYFKTTIGVSVFEHWFMKRKYR
jgi:long-subunit fatty acid transport protein